MQFLRESNLNIIGQKKIAYIFSGVLILIGIISLILHGGPKYGIDFTGGTSVQLKFSKQISAGDLRNSLVGLGYGKSEIKRIGLPEDNEVLIRMELVEEGADVAQKIEDKLRVDFPNNSYDIRSVTEIGPTIGGELRRAAMMAILISLLGILVYISWRFEFKFAVGAVVALFHDVLITLGFFSLLNFEITLVVIAAFLTIVGYSLNDTIVVYDRIRENLKVLRRENFENVINTSINQTLNRTIITSGTTLLVVVVLYLIGGKVIHDFAFALIVGVLIGTYSSIFVASPIVLEWQNKVESRKNQKSALRARK